MGLIRLLSFPSAGSIDPARIHPSSPWPSRTHIPQDTLQWAPWFYSFHALHSTGHKSLSFILLPSLSLSLCVHYLDLLDVRCPICRTCDVNFCLSAPCLYLLPLLLLSYQLFSSFSLVPSVPPSDLSLLFPFFPAQSNPPPPPLLFTLSFQIPQCALLVQCAIHCQHISHGWGVAPHWNII